jgi:ACS family hexuronate transporter-like MFS transporter
MGNTVPTSYRWVIVGALWLAHVIFFMNYSCLGILAPYIKTDLDLTSVEIGLLFSAVSMGGCLGAIPAGLIVDRIGVRVLLPLAILAMSATFASLSATSFYWLFFMILLLMGVFSGATGPAATKCVVGWFPFVGRATAMAVKQTGVNFGGIFAGTFIPYILLSLTWRQSLLFVGILEAACAGIIYWLIQDPPLAQSAGPAAVDWKKFLSVLTNKKILILGGMCFLFFSCQFSFSAYLTLFLTQEHTYSIAQAGGMFALAYFTGAVARIFWGLISDYLWGGKRKGILLIIVILELISLLLLAVSSFLSAPTILVFLPIVVFGLSGIGWNAIYLTILGETAERETVGMATAVGFSMGYLGSLISPPLFGYLVDKTGFYGYSWLMLAFCAAVILLLLSRIQEKIPGNIPS